MNSFLCPGRTAGWIQDLHSSLVYNVQPYFCRASQEAQWVRIHLQCKSFRFNPLVGVNGYTLQYSCLENSKDRGELHSMGLQRVGHKWAWSWDTYFCNNVFLWIICLHGVNPSSHLGFLFFIIPTDNKLKWQSLRCIWFFATPWTVAHEALLSMEVFRQEYWSGLPFPSPGDLLNTGIEPRSLVFQADSVSSVPPGKHNKQKQKPKAYDKFTLLSLFWGWKEGEGYASVPMPMPISSTLSTFPLRFSVL